MRTKKFFKHVGIVILINFALYLTIGYLVGDYDFRNWLMFTEVFGRIFFAIWILICFGIIYILDETHDSTGN